MSRSVAFCSFTVWEMPLTTFTDQRLCVCIFTLAAAAIFTAFCRPLPPSAAAAGLFSSTTFSAVMLPSSRSGCSIKAMCTSGRTVSGLEMASTMRPPFGASACASAGVPRVAILRAARSVTSELTTHVTSISTIAPLSTSSSSRRVPSGSMILYPTSTTASVAAARAPVRPNIRRRSSGCILNIF